MKQFNMLIVLFLLGTLSLFSQEMKVSGTVTDDFGDPIPGVNVVVAKTTKGVLTDFDGNYSILTKKGERIIFSYVGMKTVTKKVEGPNLNIKLQDDILGLDEVVVTGTSGVTKRKQLGATITSITAKDLSDSKANVSIGEVLQGQVAGAKINRNSGDPSGGISIQLRGNSTVLGSSDPLYIIDGVFINNSSSSLVNLGGNTQNRLVDINPDDIERIEVLNGAAAAAIYGSRASNGVVQIFTKRGKTGETKISYKSSVNFNSIRETLPYNTAQLKWEDDGSGNLIAVPATRFNYQDYIFDNTMGYENALSLSGASEKTAYSFSLSQYDNEGIVRNTDFGRKSARIRVDQKVYDWMDVSFGSTYSNTISNSIPNGTNYGPITSLLFADNLNDVQPDENGNYPNIGWMANPIEAIDRIDASEEYHRSINDLQVELRPFTGASINYTFGLDNTNGVGLLYIPNGFNTKPNGVSEKSTSKTLLYNSDLNISYQFNITDDIKSNTGAGYGYQYIESEYFSMKNNQVLPIPGISVTNPDAVSGGGDYRAQSSIWGGYLQQSFGYKNQLFLTFAGRLDGASTFGVDNRQQFYPKISASYSISDSDFWDGLRDVVSTLKLRTAWGQAGSLSALQPYKIFTNYNIGSYGGNIGLFPESSQGSANLKPERQTELELGFDMDLFKGRVGLAFSYYEQEITDLLMPHDLSPSTGFASRIDNIGSMVNKGYEIALRAKPVKGDFSWDINGTFSTNKNRLTHVEGGKMSIGFWGSSVAITDQPLGVFYGTFYARDAAGNLVLDADGKVQKALGHYEEVTLSDGETYLKAVQDFDSNGQPVGEALKKVIGDPNPDFVASLTNNFSYKNFDFRFQFDMSHGNDVLSWDKRMGFLFAGGETAGEELSNPDIPKGFHKPKFFIYEAFVEDASYVKLREVAVSYNLKFKKSFLNEIQFTASGTNLISWDNHWGFDPEINTGGQENGVMGQQMATVPIPKVFKLGIKFKL